MALLIRNGEIVTVGSRVQADIYVENETITRIGKNLDAPPNAERIDATGKLVFPGFIDPHVHIYLPFMATFAKDTHETASIAALIGGTTTYIEMCCPSRNDDALGGYELWKSKADGKSACDYAFHMSVTKFVKETESQLRQIVADGTSSFKIFLAYKNFFGVDSPRTAKMPNSWRGCSKSCSPRGRPVPNGMNPAVPNRSKPKALAASRRSSKIQARLATWFICRARRRCARQSTRNHAA